MSSQELQETRAEAASWESYSLVSQGTTSESTQTIHTASKQPLHAKPRKPSAATSGSICEYINMHHKW